MGYLGLNRKRKARDPWGEGSFNEEKRGSEKKKSGRKIEIRNRGKVRGKSVFARRVLRTGGNWVCSPG